MSMKLKFIVSISVSVFTLALSYSSLLQSFEVSFFSAFHTKFVDKSCMFLLCNGILVFVVKNSGLMNVNCEDASKKGKFDTKALEVDAGKEIVAEVQDGQRLDYEDEEQQIGYVIIKGEAQEESGVQFIKEEEGGGGESSYVITKEEPEKSRVLVTKEEEEQGGVSDQHEQSTEELNKRCEDFIRKMKEDIKLQILLQG